MSLKIFSITLLLSVYVCLHSSAARRASRSRICCVDVTTLDMSPEVVGETYREQPARHPCVEAVLLNTDNGKLCADPEAPWVKNLIAKMTKV